MFIKCTAIVDSNSLIKATTIIFGFLTFLTLPLFGQNDFYAKHWSQVYKYELKDLPKSSLSVVDTIYERAKHERNIPQVTKALIYQSKFALVLNENAEL